MLLLAATCAGAQTITFGSGVTIGDGVTFPATYTVPPPPTGLTFTPPAGHQVGGINVGIAYTPAPSVPIFFTIDGTTPSIASTKYTAPIPVATNTTINAIVENIGTASQNIQNSSSGWKEKTINGGNCHTKIGGTYYGPNNCPTSYPGGGIGGNMPYSWYWTFNSGGVMNETMTSFQNLSGETQMLTIYNGPAANSATQIAQHKCVEAVDPSGKIANNEMDIEQVDTAHTINGLPVNHNVGLQCNQSGSHSGHWQVAGLDTWQTTTITNGCPISTASYTCIDYSAHWALGDTGCEGNGGAGCIYLDNLTVRTNCTAAGVCSGTTTSTNLSTLVSPYGYPNGAVAARSENWAAGCGLQDQIDILAYSGGTTGAAGYTVGRNIGNENVTCGNSTVTIGSATYSF
jgi:chitobiase/beta-hexosaminidase-like protein